MLAMAPVSSGTQSAGPAGGDGSGHRPDALSWYGVWQPVTIDCLSAAAPVPSHWIALVRLPPVPRSRTVWGVSLRLPLRPMVTVSVWFPPATIEYGAPGLTALGSETENV